MENDDEVEIRVRPANNTSRWVRIGALAHRDDRKKGDKKR